jgi:hypothetical protein
VRDKARDKGMEDGRRGGEVSSGGGERKTER